MKAVKSARAWLSVFACCVAFGPFAARGADGFPLRDGDTWVMVGDSITAQHLHSNYFEAFCYARFQKLNFCFRNSGVGGDTIPKVLARFDWDVAPWKPTVVSVELGMNDKGGYSVEQFITNMGQLDEKIHSAGARPVYLTASPVNNGEIQPRLAGNQRLHEYADALKKFAADKKAPYADQFHPIVDVWGRNKPQENLANALIAINNTAKDDKLVGVEHLRAFLAARKDEPQPVSMQGDAVHPGAPGQLIMAAALLQALEAPGLVSRAVLAADGKVVEAKACAISNVQASGGKLSFDRLDESAAFPIPDEARGVLPLFPGILQLSQYTLQIDGLAGKAYKLSADGTPLGTVTAKQLAEGINLTDFAVGPIANQGKAILAAVAAKEGAVGEWRSLSRMVATEPGRLPDGKERLAAVSKKVEELDAKIREAAKPRKLHFELQVADGS